ncbi:MAG: hypothetical protein NVS3B26_23600 [Mycobacteriales bacterium]
METGPERDAAASGRDTAARARDDAARLRRTAADHRDAEAARRDRRSREVHDDGDPGFPDRFLAGRDVDDAAGDRADALEDEQHARRDRQRASDDRQAAADERVRATRAADLAQREIAALREDGDTQTVIGQATGLLMAQRGIGADDALDLLMRESQERNVPLRDIARAHLGHVQPRRHVDL